PAVGPSGPRPGEDRATASLGGKRCGTLAQATTVTEEYSPMRTRAGWIALVLTGGLALAPATVRAQGVGGLDIPGRESEPVVPLPIYNNRPEAGGFYSALEFVMFRQTRDFGSQRVAVRGGVDFDGSIQADLGGTFIVVGGTVQFLPGPPGAPGSFVGSGT